MTFPYVSILPSVDEVKGELKMIVKTSSFSEEDIYGWMVEASRLTGGCSYEPANAYIDVKKHVAILPKTFYLLDSIFLCSHKPEMGDLTVRPYVPTRVIRPADTVSRNLCTEKCNVNPDTDLSFTIKRPPGIARFSFTEGVVYIEFQKMSLDKDGSVLIQDEPNVLKAIKCYAKLMLVQEKYILQQIPRYIYKDLQDEWDQYRDEAQRIAKFPSVADNHYAMLKIDARFRTFRYKDQ